MIGHAVEHLHLSFAWVTLSNQLWFFDGVTVFFIISGFFVYTSYEKTRLNNNTTKYFFIKRALRIIPAIYVYAIFTIVYLSLIGVINFNVISNKGFIGWGLSNIFLIPVYHPSIFSEFGIGVLNGSLWTIPTEVSFYIIVPLLGILANKTSFKKMISSVLVIGLCGVLLMNVLNGMDYEPIYVKLLKITFVPYLIYFGIGVLYTKLWNKLPKNKLMFLSSLLTYTVLRFNILIDYRPIFKGLYSVVCVIPLSYLIFYIGYNAPKILNKVTDKIGDLSYGIYIWHMIVINSFIYFNIPSKLSNLSDTLNILIVYFITGTIAFLSWHLVEKKFLKMKKLIKLN